MLLETLNNLVNEAFVMGNPKKTFNDVLNIIKKVAEEEGEEVSFDDEAKLARILGQILNNHKPNPEAVKDVKRLARSMYGHELHSHTSPLELKSIAKKIIEKRKELSDKDE